MKAITEAEAKLAEQAERVEAISKAIVESMNAEPAAAEEEGGDEEFEGIYEGLSTIEGFSSAARAESTSPPWSEDAYLSGSTHSDSEEEDLLAPPEDLPSSVKPNERTTSNFFQLQKPSSLGSVDLDPPQSPSAVVRSAVKKTRKDEDTDNEDTASSRRLF